MLKSNSSLLLVMMVGSLPQSVDAQGSRRSFAELGLGIARWAEHPAFECANCPPPLKRAAFGLVGRAGFAFARRMDVAVEGRFLSGGGFHFATLFASGSISLAARPAPWLRLGIGAYWEPEFCDVVTQGATGNPSFQCGSTMELGAGASAGIQWAVSERVRIGPEIGYFQRVPERGNFSILTIGITARRQ